MPMVRTIRPPTELWIARDACIATTWRIAFLACGLLFVAAAPSFLLANILMYGFVGARLAHTLAYATKQSHEVRATFYTIGSVVVIIMAVYALAAAIL
jgi:glutathione S-transferase